MCISNPDIHIEDGPGVHVRAVGVSGGMVTPQHPTLPPREIAVVMPWLVSSLDPARRSPGFTVLPEYCLMTGICLFPQVSMGTDCGS